MFEQVPEPARKLVESSFFITVFKPNNTVGSSLVSYKTLRGLRASWLRSVYRESDRNQRPQGAVNDAWEWDGRLGERRERRWLSAQCGVSSLPRRLQGVCSAELLVVMAIHTVLERGNAGTKALPEQSSDKPTVAAPCLSSNSKIMLFFSLVTAWTPSLGLHCIHGLLPSGRACALLLV